MAGRGWVRAGAEGALDELGTQYLAFIHYYTEGNGLPPAEGDLQHGFGVNAPSAHHMVVTFEEARLILRVPRTPGNMAVAIPAEEISTLR